MGENCRVEDHKVFPTVIDSWIKSSFSTSFFLSSSSTLIAVGMFPARAARWIIARESPGIVDKLPSTLPSVRLDCMCLLIGCSRSWSRDAWDMLELIFYGLNKTFQDFSHDTTPHNSQVSISVIIKWSSGFMSCFWLFHPGFLTLSSLLRSFWVTRICCIFRAVSWDFINSVFICFNLLQAGTIGGHQKSRFNLEPIS